MSACKFNVQATDGRARLGVLKTKNSTIHTPIFMPVGTKATVKAMTPEEVIGLGAEIILANTYHLMLRPGADIVKGLGGLHKMMNWPRAILTDSGGYQVFSLSLMNKVTEEGVLFQSHIDGEKVMLTPEKAIEIQQALGSDIMMVLDECLKPGVSEEKTRESMELSIRWAARCAQVKRGENQALFGIVQGGIVSRFKKGMC